MIYRVEKDGPFQAWFVRCDGDERNSCLFWGPESEKNAHDYATWRNKGEEYRLCLGYEGGCDGDLPGERHEEKCPAAVHLQALAELT